MSAPFLFGQIVKELSGTWPGDFVSLLLLAKGFSVLTLLFAVNDGERDVVFDGTEVFGPVELAEGQRSGDDDFGIMDVGDDVLGDERDVTVGLEFV